MPNASEFLRLAWQQLNTWIPRLTRGMTNTFHATALPRHAARLPLQPSNTCIFATRAESQLEYLAKRVNSFLVSDIACRRATRMNPSPRIKTDVCVIGAGPVALFQAYQLGLLGLDVHLMDALSVVGGQCAALYPDTPIYDVPGLYGITGAQLSASLLHQLGQLQQFQDMASRLHLESCVTHLTQAETGYDLRTSVGTRFHAGAVVIAAGVGAFLPRKPAIAGLDAIQSGLSYTASAPLTGDAPQLLILGEDEHAVATACDWAEKIAAAACSVTLSHRRAQLSASADTLARMQSLQGAGKLGFLGGIAQSCTHQNGHIQSVQLLTAEGLVEDISCTNLWVLQGLSPQLGPLRDWGLKLERKQIPVDTACFSTVQQGIYAVGDINTYPGKQRLIVCGFHEATLAAHAVLAQLYPGRVAPLQYSSSSKALQTRLALPI